MQLRRKSKFLKVGDSAIVKIRPVRPTCIETFQDFPEMGRFALRDMGATIAAGIVEITENTNYGGFYDANRLLN